MSPIKTGGVGVDVNLPFRDGEIKNLYFPRKSLTSTSISQTSG